MKNFKYLFFAILISLTSCEDAIDIEQPGQVPAEVTYKTIDGLNKNLVSLYGSIPYENTIGFTSVFTDEVAPGIANGGQGLTDGSWGYILNSGSGSANSIWYSNYRVIALANRLIEYANRNTYDAASQNKYRSIIAHARVIRAFSYSQLMTYFSENMQDPNALGVMLFTDVRDFRSVNLSRSKNKEVYAQIELDLAYGAANLTAAIDVPSAATTPIYFSLNAIKALRARVALYSGDYTNAKIYAQDLISLIPLTTRASYNTIWTDASPGEVIFKLERSINDATIGSTWTNTSADNFGSHFYEMGRSLFNALNATNGDVRKTSFVQGTSIIANDYETVANYRTADQLYIGKYFGSQIGSQIVYLLNDIKVFRMSEMYFIKAESLVHEGDLAGAADVIKLLRAQRISPAPVAPVYNNAQEAWAGILNERRIELCFEGHRYVDMRRLGQKAGLTFDRYKRDCDINQSCDFTLPSHKMVLPIPSLELNANTAIRSQQNPNY